MKHLIRILCATLVLGSVALAGKPAPTPAPIHPDGSRALWAT
jgi:hypothetical protein